MALQAPSMEKCTLSLSSLSGHGIAGRPVSVSFTLQKSRVSCAGAVAVRASVTSERRRAVDRDGRAEGRGVSAFARDHLSVGDCCTKGQLHLVKPSTSVDEALELLVNHRITGMPVVDDDGKLVGLVSDYDLLALDAISGSRDLHDGMFPAPTSSWKTFRHVQQLLAKNHGRTVGDVMTPQPLLCVRPMTNLEDAARMLIESKFRRLPVVDENGLLVGLLTRGNVVRAALMLKRAAEGRPPVTN